MIWALSFALFVAVASLGIAATASALELRRYHQAARARVHELEKERTGMIQQVADARGVTLNPTDPQGLSPKPHRDFTIDPQTGNTLYSDGTVVSPDGAVLLTPDDMEMTRAQIARVLG